MINSKTWLERKKASLSIVIALIAVSLCVIYYSGEKGVFDNSDYYSVTIRHYGVNASEMERSITIPLEDAISQIHGLANLQSSSENSTSKVFVRFSGKAKGRYDDLREAAQRVYENLPQSVQRPEIKSSDSSRIPVWAAAVAVKGNFGNTSPADIEKILKPRLESLDGAGEVLLSGVGIQEVIVNIDQEKASLLGLAPAVVASVMAMNDSVFPCGYFVQGEKEIIASVDGRFESIGDILVPLGDGKSIMLSDIASVVEQERKPDSFSRINGKKAIVVSIMAGSGSDLRKLSENIKREISDPLLPFEFTILSDRGAEEGKALKSVFAAALQGALMVMLISFLLYWRLDSSKPFFSNAGILCGLSVPFVCLASAAFLCSTGLPVKRIVLAGIAAGVGTAVDAIILCSERLISCKSYSDARFSMKRLYGPLFAGSITTVAALLPVKAMGNSDAGVIALAIAVVTLCSLVFSIGPLPPLLLWNLNSADRHQKCKLLNKKNIFDKVLMFGNNVFRRISRKAGKMLALNTRFCVRYPRLVIVICLIITLTGFLALFFRGADSSAYGSGNSVYAHVEFEGSLLAEEADYLLAAYGELISGIKGIINVETSARTGSGSVIIAYDPKIIKTEKVIHLAKKSKLSGMFVYFPEAARGIRHWEIKIFGDEVKKCREIAEETAFALAASPVVKERVLNFKQGSRMIKFSPDREKLSYLGLGFGSFADDIRRAVYGPVAYKRLSPQGETDVRVKLGGVSNREPGKSQVMEILLPHENTGKGNSGTLNVESLFHVEEDYEISSIRRDDRRRTASITVITKAMDPRRVYKKIRPVLAETGLPPGYSLEFDPDAIREANNLSGTVIHFIMALLFCYMVLASINESFTVPLAILFSVLPSMAIPAIFISVAGFPLNMEAACAFIAVSGMTINAAVLCMEGMNNALSKRNGHGDLALFKAIRKNFPALIATTATTVAGAIPFIFLGENENILIRTMSLVTVFGVSGSCLFAVSAAPSFFLLMKRKKSAFAD